MDLPILVAATTIHSATIELIMLSSSKSIRVIGVNHDTINPLSTEI
jgi:hypothetical protein